MNKINVIVLPLLAIAVLSCKDKENMGPKCINAPVLKLQMKKASCGVADGAIAASVQGGVEPYEYSIDWQNFQSSGEFVNLPIGNYAVIVKDKNNCGDTLSIDIEEANTISASFTLSPAGCGATDGKINVTSSGGNGLHNYSLNGAPFQTSGSYSGLAPRIHKITIKDQAGCSKILTIQIPTGISYSATIKNIIITKCATPNCHVAGGEGPINLTDFSQVQNNADNIKRKTEDGSMPLKGSLTKEQVDQIACWVNDGALNN